ncbi:MAG TPA: hypothetical protein VGD65_04750 [Chryseosolibacter sp.]
MKFSIRLFLPVALLSFISSCSPDEIVEPTALTEDKKTYANYYEDQFLTLYVAYMYDYHTLNFHLTGNGGKVSVNWGDGVIEKKILYENQKITFTHRYATRKNYTIRVSGEITTITRFEIHQQDMPVDKIHFGGLTNLRELELDYMSNSPYVVNLSRNKELVSAKFYVTARLYEVILSTTNKITNLEISGPNSINTPNADRVVARIHDSVINNPRTGTINLEDWWDKPYGPPLLTGPPSSYSINKLKKLRDRYGWTVIPERFEEALLESEY